MYSPKKFVVRSTDVDFHNKFIYVSFKTTTNTTLNVSITFGLKEIKKDNVKKQEHVWHTQVSDKYVKEWKRLTRPDQIKSHRIS